MKKHYLLLLLPGILFYLGCSKDELPQRSETMCEGEVPTYTTEIRPIIDLTCAYSGCHLDSAPGIFDSYNGLTRYLESGEFRQRVIDLRTDDVLGMPPDYAPPGRAKQLTEEEIDLIDCWLDAGAPR